MVPTFTWNRSTGEVPSFALQHRHGYAADLHRGLRTGDINPPTSSPSTEAEGVRRYPAQIRQIRAGGLS